MSEENGTKKGGVAQVEVSADEDGMRLDRWFSVHYPDLAFGRLQRILRKGEVRVDRGRVKSSTRLAAGQIVRVPPMGEAKETSTPAISIDDARFLRDIMLYEDDEIYVFNKPSGLAVQGGTSTKRHMDGLLAALPNKKGEKPRLVHRLDKDTSGILVVARTRAAASHFGKVFRTRSARKIYWALVAGVPRPHQGKISMYIRRDSEGDGENMVPCNQGQPGAVHSISYYSVIEHAGRKVSWVSLKPVTGRTHQLRVHMAAGPYPILNDPKYFNIENWETPGNLGEGLHLHARRLTIPKPKGGVLDITAPLPPHMLQSFDALGFDGRRYDDSQDDPEEPKE